MSINTSFFGIFDKFLKKNIIFAMFNNKFKSHDYEQITIS
jgi:hypothetical protein